MEGSRLGIHMYISICFDPLGMRIRGIELGKKKSGTANQAWRQELFNSELDLCIYILII